jgi:hypothetical protein
MNTPTTQTRTLADWLREAAYIQRNASWQSWAGAMKLTAIRLMLRDQIGMSDTAFFNWLERIQRHEQAATQLNHTDYTRLDEAQAGASQ